MKPRSMSYRPILLGLALFAGVLLLAAQWTGAAEKKAGEAKGKPAAAASGQQAKDLYYESGGSQPGAPPRIGLRYKIILKDLDGDIRTVTDRFKFSTGDSIRFVFESNIDGYLYIYHKGASSKGVQLFPDPRINEGRNKIKKYTEVTIPPRVGQDKGWFKFDKKTGKEELYIFLAPKPIDSLNTLRTDENSNVDDNGWQTVTSETKKGEGGKRDLYFESESFEGEENHQEPSVGYVVTQSPILIHQIELKHVP
ncbi:MAG: DUF4384 domain-containing protein [Candidatus Sumerlaeota bacterium]|nr:DUF4384 domain-containing protein [Candidatus Sumerlaeota bacterium]